MNYGTQSRSPHRKQPLSKKQKNNNSILMQEFV